MSVRDYINGVSVVSVTVEARDSIKPATKQAIAISQALQCEVILLWETHKGEFQEYKINPDTTVEAVHQVFKTR